MEYEINVIDNKAEFSEAVGEIASGKKNELILGKWVGELLEFAGVVFPGVDPQDIFAIKQTRQGEGKGPHFDVYRSFVNEEKPWLGHYNMKGESDVLTTVLADDLAAAYEARYPEQSPESADARRHFSRIALTEPGARVGHGFMDAGTRMVLPVRPNGPHIIHDIIAKDPSQDGEYVKLIVATSSKDERSDLQVHAGYKPLDTFLTGAVGFDVPAPVKEKRKAEKEKPTESPLVRPTPSRSSQRIRETQRISGRSPVRPRWDEGSRRRRCSGLD